MFALAAATATVLLLLSGLHVYWALGGSWGLKASIPALPESGKPLFVPSPAAALAVATALAIAAGLVVANFYASSTPVKLVTWGMGAVFLLRAMGDFRYVGFFKKIHSTGFARMDTLFYSPLCTALGIAALLIARFS